MPSRIPKKLTKDSIIEAIFEIRFESTVLPEVLLGRLSDAWSPRIPIRLPVMDIPLPIRLADPNLKYVAALEIRLDNGHVVKIGTNVISYHVPGEYCGWPEFKSALNTTCSHLFDKCPDVEINRLGLRYLNAINRDDHHIESISDLSLDIKIDGNRITGPQNFNFLETHETNYLVMTRVASREFVQGAELPPATTAFVDIDVYEPFFFYCRSKNPDEIIDWLEKAHTHEKIAFFKLIPKNVLELITEEWEE